MLNIKVRWFYEDDCWWDYYNDDGSYYDTWQTDLTVDYGPCKALYKLLEKSGVEEKHIRSICPWKTSIKIDERDNSVIYRTYGKKEVLWLNGKPVTYLKANVRL